MKIITDVFEKISDSMEKNVVTIGKFDGVHRGHQLLFDTMNVNKGAGCSIVFTFDFNIRKTLINKNAKYIFDRQEKLKLLEEYGIDILIECPFTDEIRLMDAEVFVKDILLKQLNAGCIIIGEDNCFGYERRGNAELLEKMSLEYGFDFIKLDKLKDENDEISATIIREELSKGNIGRVNRCLGFNYFFEGIVCEGAKIGRTIGFPTVNQEISDDKLLPPFGVYASEILVDKRRYPAITNIGVKPTVTDISKPVVESFLYDFSGDLYGKRIKTELLSYMRPEMKFQNLNELKKQIETDKKNRNNRNNI